MNNQNWRNNEKPTVTNNFVNLESCADISKYQLQYFNQFTFNMYLFFYSFDSPTKYPKYHFFLS